MGTIRRVPADTVWPTIGDRAHTPGRMARPASYANVLLRREDMPPPYSPPELQRTYLTHDFARGPIHDGVIPRELHEAAEFLPIWTPNLGLVFKRPYGRAHEKKQGSKPFNRRCLLALLTSLLLLLGLLILLVPPPPPPYTRRACLLPVSVRV